MYVLLDILWSCRSVAHVGTYVQNILPKRYSTITSPLLKCMCMVCINANVRTNITSAYYKRVPYLLPSTHPPWNTRLHKYM